MSADARATRGRRAEALVEAHLVAKGYEIVARNCRVGRLELDIIARRGSLLAIVEVRSRSNPKWGSPALSVTKAKRRRIVDAAMRWIKDNRPGTRQLRFDVAAVTFHPDRDPDLKYYDRAFTRSDL